MSYWGVKKRLSFQYVNLVLLKFGSLFLIFLLLSVETLKIWKGYIITKLEHIFIHERVKGDVYNDQVFNPLLVILHCVDYKSVFIYRFCVHVVAIINILKALW